MPGKYKLVGRRAKTAKRMMRKITTVFEKNDIPYVLEAGTLLGVVREDRLLPWDDDVDITVTRQYEEKLLSILWKFKLMGYKVRIRKYKKDRKFFKKDDVRIIKIKHFTLPTFQSDVIVDIFLKKLVGEEYYWTVDVKKPVLKSAPRRFYENITEIEFDGKLYSVPQDYRGYLCYHFGDWQTPVKEWKFRTDDNCMKEILD